MLIAVDGALQYESDWQISGQFLQEMAGLGRSSTLKGYSGDSASSFELFIPLQLVDGRYRIDGTVSYGRVANATLELGGRRFSSIDGGSLTVRSADYPPRPGLEPGLIRGTMTFKAVEHGVTSVDTITVTAYFAALWYHDLKPTIQIEFSGGGPAVGLTIGIEGGAERDQHDGWLVSWYAALADPNSMGPLYFTQRVRLAVLAVDTLPFGNISPAIRANPDLWPAVFADVSYQNHSAVALSTGGSLMLTRVIPASPTYYGEIRGTLSSRLALWADDTTVTADTLQAAVAFTVPIWPLNAVR